MLAKIIECPYLMNSLLPSYARCRIDKNQPFELSIKSRERLWDEQIFTCLESVILDGVDGEKPNM